MPNLRLLDYCSRIFLVVAIGAAVFSVQAQAQTVKRAPVTKGVQGDYQSGKNTETVKLKSAVIKLVTRSQGINDVEESYVMIDGKKKFKLSHHLNFIDVDPTNDIAVIDESSPGSGCKSLYHIVYKNSANTFVRKSFDWACNLTAIEYSPKKMVLYFNQYSSETGDYQPTTGVLVFE